MCTAFFCTWNGTKHFCVWTPAWQPRDKITLFNTWLKNFFQTFFFFFHDKIWPLAGPAGPTMSPTLYHLWTLPAREWLSVWGQSRRFLRGFSTGFVTYVSQTSDGKERYTQTPEEDPGCRHNNFRGTFEEKETTASDWSFWNVRRQTRLLPRC